MSPLVPHIYLEFLFTGFTKCFYFSMSPGEAGGKGCVSVCGYVSDVCYAHIKYSGRTTLCVMMTSSGR